MVKWASYLISAVHYNKEHTRIESVLQHVDNDDSVGGPTTVSRSIVVSNIDSGYSYCTIRKNGGTWNRGDNVIPYYVDGEHFIRTDGNKTKSDNLGELPEF